MTTPGYTPELLAAALPAAIRAPSMHNSQPWRFRLRDGGIEVRVERGRPLPVAGLGDLGDWAAHLACGAAVFNLRLALVAEGAPARVRIRPYTDEPDVVARLEPDEPALATPAERALLAAVPRRHSSRMPFSHEPVPGAVRWRLVEAARAEGGWLDLVVGTAAVAAFGELARGANRVLERDPGYRAEIAAWTRHGPAPDGVPVRAGGPVAEPWDLLPQRPFGDQVRAPGRDFEPEPLVAVLGAAGDTPVDRITAGQALQRVLLTATDAGLAASMLSQPIEVAAARERLRTALSRFGSPQMVLRLGYGQPGWPTPRRPAADVVDTPIHSG
ncbi:nitroreductase family protein [Phytohabitans sp. ZYX-F-186]|uniref:Nitroreductase family protein n=1 Tax=Phytohabitans maris TaxID=3071409 RepID=A0ABU0ZJC6_9ACTN|nr:nitroreductase family protein [Phytohabitans sp. ZYX-F-186]MDQ7906380.1 nitroreductase family protein [Phytohabitans sp. ZYX-F-186]